MGQVLQAQQEQLVLGRWRLLEEQLVLDQLRL